MILLYITVKTTLMTECMNILKRKMQRKYEIVEYEFNFLT